MRVRRFKQNKVSFVQKKPLLLLGYKACLIKLSSMCSQDEERSQIEALRFIKAGLHLFWPTKYRHILRTVSLHMKVHTISLARFYFGKFKNYLHFLRTGKRSLLRYILSALKAMEACCSFWAFLGLSFPIGQCLSHLLQQFISYGQMNMFAASSMDLPLLTAIGGM